MNGTRPRIEGLSEAVITPDGTVLHFTIETDAGEKVPIELAITAKFINEYDAILL